MSYRLINANDLNGKISEEDYKVVLDSPCIYADLPSGLDDGYYEVYKWIPVGERLPEECGSYLITLLIKLFPSSDEYATEIRIAYYSTLSGKWLHHSNDFEIVSAWMPLPEPYKEGE